MNKGDSVRLVRDVEVVYCEEYSRSIDGKIELASVKSDKYQQGQTGKVLLCRGQMATVELDGYENEKAKAEEFRKQFGEPLNIVPFYQEFKVEDLERL